MHYYHYYYSLNIEVVVVVLPNLPLMRIPLLTEERGRRRKKKKGISVGPSQGILWTPLTPLWGLVGGEVVWGLWAPPPFLIPYFTTERE